MPVIFTVPVVLGVRTVTGADALGNDVYTSVPTTVDGVFAPGSSSEQVQGQDMLVTQDAVYLQTGTVLGAIDSVTVGGVMFEVDGQPIAWPPNPFTGWQPDYSVEVKLKAVSG